MSDIITVVRDPNHPLGKRFSIDNGKIVRNSSVAVSCCEAVQRHVPDVHALQDLLLEVAEDIHAAIINSAFPLVPVGQPFIILSEREFKKAGVSRYDASRTWPVTHSYRDHPYPALGRFTEHTAPSSWILLDRDIDEHTPERFAQLTYNDWMVEVEKLLPGILSCARLCAHSSSARVTFDGGQPVGAGNGHTWVQVANPADIERMRRSILPRAMALGMAWLKPKRYRKTNEVSGKSLTTIIDPSVFVKGRLVFVGKPEVEDANF